MKNFTTLQLSKKSVAKLNDAQLSSVKGGNQIAAPGDSVVINCQIITASIISMPPSKS